MMTGLVVRKGERGGMEVVKLERVQVICPACGQQVEAVARDGRVIRILRHCQAVCGLFN